MVADCGASNGLLNWNGVSSGKALKECDMSDMSQIEKAGVFAGLHIKGDPILLYNIWDAGSAKALAGAGATVLATASWSVAAAQGYDDSEAIPFDLLDSIVRRITTTVDLPLTVDFESGYARDPETIMANVHRLIAAGAIGVNFEDQIVGGEGLYTIQDQVRRIAAIRQAAQDTGVPLFINARTDLFIKERDRTRHAALIADAQERAAAYQEAGANGFFVPFLMDPELIAAVCESVPLPINIIMLDGTPPISDLATLGVARISCGPGPYLASMAALAARFQAMSAGTK
jgi:2-methylisocitrate lyase-like PEP mutase family enzyme